MANYIKKPSKTVVQKERVVEKIVEKPKESNQSLDVSALANAIAQAIDIKIPQQVAGEAVSKDIDTFKDNKTLERIADQMLVERGASQANFNDLGNVKKTKKDQKDIDKTINLLSNLDD